MALSQYPFKGGIPTGNTAARPSGPAQGDVYYNGQLGLLEIYDGANWVPCSAPAGIPTVVGVDVGTGRAYESGAIDITFTAGTNGGAPYGYTATATSGALNYTTGATALTTTTLVVGNPGTYSLSGTAYNGFGTSPTSSPSNVNVTTLPQTPTIGTATAAATTNEITVTWTNRNNGGKNLSAITITPFLNGTTAETSRTAATTSSTSYTFTAGQLTLGASYTFKVKATNANGTCADSTASNSATMPNYITIDFLTVAGGGGGGHGDTDGTQSSGGGAGGLRSSYGATGGGGSLESALSLTKATNYTVTVGGGGAVLGDGTNSVFSTITALKGGAGGSGGGGNGSGGSGTYGSGGGQGGSGGGGTTNNAAGTAGQGYAGGSATFGGGADAAGGGGGAGSAGGNASGSTAGTGGNGINNSITGTSVGYAGGGGNNGNLGFGGGYNGTGNRAGVANRGGGGKGSTTGTGGSGVVIVRWLTSAGTITVGAGLTADSTGTDGSYSYKRFTAGSGNVSWS